LRKIGYILIFFIITACGSVSFKRLSLYDEYEKPLEKALVEQIIFQDAAGTMWNSLFNCGQFEVTKEAAYSGNSSIKLSWDKSKGCTWIGFGNSFSNWTASDMSKERFSKALSFYVRTQSGSARSIPIVAAMEDFGGGGSYHFIDARKYLYGLEIDTSWKQIIVPLWDFPVNEEEVDIYSIKQIQFQLEGAGSFFLDEIKLIDFSKEKYDKMRTEVEAMKPKGNFNQIIYKPGKLEEDAWAVGKKPCHVLEEKKDAQLNDYIYWNFSTENCNWAKWGINWNNWYQINLRGVTNDAQLEFKFKSDNKAVFRILLEDFNGKSVELFSNKTLLKENVEWQNISIPLKDKESIKKDLQLDQIKQLLFEGISSGEVLITDIKITQIWQ
jgi:hypothetical protein